MTLDMEATRLAVKESAVVVLWLAKRLAMVNVALTRDSVTLRGAAAPERGEDSS
jgi:hypothetical protein